MIATQPESRQLLGVNQQSYQSLKASLGLHLRRQLLIAVCDSVVMQNQLAAQLEADLVNEQTANRQGNQFEATLDSYGEIAPLSKQPLARLVFDPSDGNLPKQVAHWVRQTILSGGPLPHVQVLGIEQMTRQPAITQNHFLRSLEKVDALLPRLDTSLLIWVPWPWLRTIQQSAPTFWNWRNGVFEFVGDPTPVETATPQFNPALNRTSTAPVSVAASPMTSSIPALPTQMTPAEEDDLSSLFDEEFTAQDRIDRSGNLNRNSAVDVRGETVKRQSLAALGGLNSIVTKGVNADIEDMATAINRSAERAGSVQKETSVVKSEASDPLAAGRAYRAQIEAGDRSSTTIESAISAYESDLNTLSENNANWSVGLNDLGTLYWLKAQQTEDSQQRIQTMQRSIELYKNALEKLRPGQNALISQLYSNLGAVYTMLATYQDSAQSLNLAINAYLKALPTCSLEANPTEYAILSNSLGSVYWKLSHHEQAPSNLTKAVEAYRNALSGYNPKAQPLDYAAAQNNLGITYWSLAKHEAPVDNLKQALAAYRDALNYRTPAADSTACAITYNNLALAYWDLSKVKEQSEEKTVQAQKNAIAAFEAALNVSHSSGALSNMDSTAIYHCLGDVHGQMADTVSSPEEIGASLSKSLYSYIQSLQGVSEAAPVYASRIESIVSNLRSHYAHLGLEGQQAALNKVPGNLIAPVLAAL